MAAPNKVLCCVVIVLLGIGIYDVLTNFENCRCAMSYMWEIPEYIEVQSMNKTLQERYPQYSLTVYGEGVYAKNIKKMKLTGIPVLFIPGNAGSHKQVRSLSSIALQKAKKYNFHFNYFSVNLNEELNAVYGGVLDGQTEYVHGCVKHILQLYKNNKNNKNPPKQIVIIGHSKGGLVAKALFALPDFDASSVNTLITMGTPHLNAVAKPDIYMDQFTSNVNKFWSDERNAAKLRDVTILSIGGSYRDYMVRSGLTSLDGTVPSDTGLSVVVGSIPLVWLSTDHRCIVWCKELVLVTNRALFDMVDKLTRQISVNADYRMKVLKHHFVSHDGQSSYAPRAEDVIGFGEDNFKAVPSGFHHVAGRHIEKAMHYTFPINPEDPNHELFTVTASLPATVPATSAWLYACIRSHEDRCIEGVDITGRVHLMPPLKANMRVAHLDMKNLGIDNVKQIVVKIPRTNKVNLIADLHGKAGRIYNATLPGFFSYKPKTIMKQHDSHTLFFNISLPELDSIWKAYTAILEPAHCLGEVRRDGNTTLHFHVPWFQEDEWSVAKATEDNVMSLKLQSGRPADDDRPVQLHAYVYSRCHYRLRIAVSHKEILGQLMRFHGNLLPSFVVDVALLTLSYLLANLAKNKPVDSFINIMSTHCKPFVVVPFIAVIRKIIPNLSPSLAEADNFKMLDDQGINFGLLPILFFLFGYVILTVMAALMEMDVAFFGKLLSLFKGTSITIDSAPYTGSLGYSLLLYAVLGGLMAVSVGSCGAVVLIVLVVLYLLKVITLQARVYVLKGCLNLKKDAAEKDEDGKEKEKKEETGAKSQDNGSATSAVDTSPPSLLDVAQTSLYFHFAVMILTLLLASLNLPSLAFWVKNMKHEIYNLERDPALYPTLVVIAALTILLDPAYTIPKKTILTRGISFIVYSFCLIALVFASDAMYRLSYLLAAAIFLAAINQAIL